LKLPQEHQKLSSPPSSFRFNLKDHNLIGAGQYNGQFTVYDMRKSGNGPAETTPVDVSHRDPVYDLAWLQSKTGTEAMTVSTDGNVGRDGEGTSGALRYWVSALFVPKAQAYLWHYPIYQAQPSISLNRFIFLPQGCFLFLLRL